VVVLSEEHRLLASGPVSEILRDEELLVRANLIEDRRALVTA